MIAQRSRMAIAGAVGGVFHDGQGRQIGHHAIEASGIKDGHPYPRGLIRVQGQQEFIAGGDDEGPVRGEDNVGGEHGALATGATAPIVVSRPATPSRSKTAPAGAVTHTRRGWADQVKVATAVAVRAGTAGVLT